MASGNLQPDTSPVVALEKQQGPRGELVGNLVQRVSLGCLILLTLQYSCCALLGKLLVPHCFLSQQELPMHSHICSMSNNLAFYTTTQSCGNRYNMLASSAVSQHQPSSLLLKVLLSARLCAPQMDLADSQCKVLNCRKSEVAQELQTLCTARLIQLVWCDAITSMHGLYTRSFEMKIMHTSAMQWNVWHNTVLCKKSNHGNCILHDSSLRCMARCKNKTMAGPKHQSST